MIAGVRVFLVIVFVGLGYSAGLLCELSQVMREGQLARSLGGLFVYLNFATPFCLFALLAANASNLRGWVVWVLSLGFWLMFLGIPQFTTGTTTIQFVPWPLRMLGLGPLALICSLVSTAFYDLVKVTSERRP